MAIDLLAKFDWLKKLFPIYKYSDEFKDICGSAKALN